MANIEGVRRLSAETLVPQTTGAFAWMGDNPIVFLLIGGMVLVVLFTTLCLLYLRTLEQEAEATERQAERHPSLRSPERANIRVPKSMNSSPLSLRPSATLTISGAAATSYRGAIQGSSLPATSQGTEVAEGSIMKSNHLRVVPTNPDALRPGRAVADLSLQEQIAVLHQYVYENVVRLGELRRRINSLELLMGERMHLANRSVNFGLLKSRRVVRAVEARLQAIEQLLANPNSEQVELACTLMASDINVPKDAVNALLDEEPISPLSPTEWSDSAEYLLYDAESQVKHAINE